MFTLLACSLLLTTQAPPAEHPPVDVGWHDEFSSFRRWKPLAMENKAKAVLASRGNLTLSLGRVPNGWPYSYQWSGLKRNIEVDLSKHPVLMAYVSDVHGYAHLDIDVLDTHGKVVRTLRSTTMNVTAERRRGFVGRGIEPDFVAPQSVTIQHRRSFADVGSRPGYPGPQTVAGVCSIDLGKELDLGVHRFQIRLIVGGDNSGCYATYHWLRFVSQADSSWLAQFPQFPRIKT